MSLSLSETSHSNCIELKLSGSALSKDEFSEFNTRVNELIEAGRSNLILNLDGIKLLNSLGINVLIRVFTRCRNHGGDLYIVNISDKINQVLLLTKLNTVLNIAPSVQTAVTNFNSY
ncbi:MAG: STAS domain-containing protein [Bacteroidetes bacterium]|nr:STAS domain-containing protein [Bacteroidota bacterium]